MMSEKKKKDHFFEAPCFKGDPVSSKGNPLSFLAFPI
jgi:hypothetical protein